MIKKFKRKYYFTVFVVIVLVFVAMIVSLNVMTIRVAEETIDSRLMQLLALQTRTGDVSQTGDMPQTGENPQMGGGSSGFSGGASSNIGGFNIGTEGVSSEGNIMVEINESDGTVTIYYNSLTKTEDEIYEIAVSVIDSGKESGNIGYDYFMQAKTEGFTYYAITDATQELAVKTTMQESSIIIFIISVLLVAGIAFILSAWSIKPIDDAMKKQKQFISDASHELKTPLSVISINSEIIKRETGESDWCDAIISETTRMNELVNDMLTLSQLDEGCQFAKIEFDLSNTISSVALLLEVFAYEKGKQLKYEIEPNIALVGVESKIKQLAIILIENAVKNSFIETDINLSLKKVNGNIVMSVKNIGETIPKELQDKLFERFYRVDNSRNLETGGFGLGLCIAKSIADLHKAKMSVSSEDGKTCFKVTFKQ